MPTSATHITIVRRIADSGPQYRALLGDPDPTLPLTDPAAQRMRFASLGACGPDFLYLLMDYGSDAQDLANLLVRAAAAFDSLASLMAGVQERIDGEGEALVRGPPVEEQRGGADRRQRGRGAPHGRAPRPPDAARHDHPRRGGRGARGRAGVEAVAPPS